MSFNTVTPEKIKKYELEWSEGSYSKFNLGRRSMDPRRENTRWWAGCEL